MARRLATITTPLIRWMIRRDMPEVLAIERDSFEHPWSDQDFTRCLRQRNCMGMLAEQDGRVAAYMVYELHQRRLHLLNLAVLRDCRRQGLGRAMVAKLIGKLSSQRRSRLDLEVRETNLDAQLFFRACGFRAISVLRDHYPTDRGPQDAYVFQYRYREESA